MFAPSPSLLPPISVIQSHVDVTTMELFRTMFSRQGISTFSFHTLFIQNGIKSNISDCW